MKRYFITGTDTDCGKTYVVCQLLDWLNKQGLQAQALKPVASGCFKINNQLLNHDIIQLQKHNTDPSQAINGWLYEPPLSPHLAAKKMDDTLSVSDLANFCDKREFANFDYQLVEGAGGLLVPLNDEETWLDFLKLTDLPVILVVGIRLGCINHALLTDQVLKAHSIRCAGWIANLIDENTLEIEEIVRTLKNKMHMPFLATVPYCGIINEINLCQDIG